MAQSIFLRTAFFFSGTSRGSLRHFAYNHVVSYPIPTTRYFWTFGSLAGFCLGIQIISGVLLALHGHHLTASFTESGLLLALAGAPFPGPEFPSRRLRRLRRLLLALPLSRLEVYRFGESLFPGVNLHAECPKLGPFWAALHHADFALLRGEDCPLLSPGERVYLTLEPGELRVIAVGPLSGDNRQFFAWVYSGKTGKVVLCLFHADSGPRQRRTSAGPKTPFSGNQPVATPGKGSFFQPASIAMTFSQPTALQRSCFAPSATANHGHQAFPRTSSSRALLAGVLLALLALAGSGGAAAFAAEPETLLALAGATPRGPGLLRDWILRLLGTVLLYAMVLLARRGRGERYKAGKVAFRHSLPGLILGFCWSWLSVRAQQLQKR